MMFRRGNTLRAIAWVLGLFGFMTFMALAPLLDAPSTDEAVELRVPSMHNVPEQGMFEVETER